MVHIFESLEHIIECFIGRLHAHIRIQDQQGLAHRLDDILGIELRLQGALFGLLDHRHVHESENHPINNVVHRPIRKDAQVVILTDRGGDLPLARLQRPEHFLNVVDQLSFGKPSCKIGDRPADVAWQSGGIPPRRGREILDLHLQVKENSRDLSAVEEVLKVAIGVVEFRRLCGSARR